jgi:hypothetical protein
MQSQQRHCFAQSISSANVWLAIEPGVGLTKKAKVTDEHRAEAARLRTLWGSTQHETQAVFGEKYGVGNQSAVGQFLRGEAPLSMKAALGFSNGLGVSIGVFSKRLAEEAELLGQAAGGAQGTIAPLKWPFKTVTPAQYYDHLTEENRATIEAITLQMVNAKREPPAQETGEQRAA